MSLTHGAIQRLCQALGKSSDPSFMPILQIIMVKKVPCSNPNQQERFRAVLSDGHNFVQGMLATQHNHYVHSGQVKDNSIIKVTDFMNNLVNNKTIIILLGFDLVNANPGEKYGNPTDIEKEPGFLNAGANIPAAQPMYVASNRVPALPSQHLNNSNQANAPNPYGAMSTNNSYGNNRSPGVITSSAPIVSTCGPSSGQPITPISALNMYQNRWTIRARVTSKSDIRHWSNAKGEGSLFSVELLDASGMDIRATFFKEAVDKFHAMLVIDKVYTFSGGRLKVANLQYNTCKSGFEITFDQNTEIHLDNDIGDIQQQVYDFVKIANLEQVEPGKNVDVLGVVKSVGQVATIMSKKTGTELTKSDLVLVDDSGVEVNCTVWGERAQNAQSEFANSPVVAFRRLRVSDFGGRSLSASASSSLNANPRIPEAQNVLRWWNSGGRNAIGVKSLSSGGTGTPGRYPAFEERKTISAIKEENLGHSNLDKPDWLSFKGTFNFIKKDKDGGAWYTACPNEGEPCKNRFKVNQTSDGNWYCEKCCGTFSKPVRRFIFSATVTDDTSTTWVSLFDDQARVLLNGVSADEVYARTHDDSLDQDAYDSYFARANFTDWVFTCKVKQEAILDEMRVKTSVYSMHPLDYVQESKDLLKALERYI